jgi:hypothetical protein
MRTVATIAMSLLVGIIIGYFALGSSDGLTKYDALDLNGDGSTDALFHYSDGLVQRAEFDRNFDGQMDYWQYYEDGIIVKANGDQNFDGNVDLWEIYEYGLPLTVQQDTDFNGLPDVTYEYSNGIVQKALWRPNSGEIVRVEAFRNGIKVYEDVDVDRDGVLETRIHFDPFGVETGRDRLN